MIQNLNTYEQRPDWKAIVESIGCPQQGCGAPAGSPCRNVSCDPFSLLGQMTRNDYHQIRKIMAVHAWQTAGMTTESLP
jgi:hypothetical protein